MFQVKKWCLMHYTLKNDAGQLLDSSENQPPLAYIQGLGHIIPGLEQALEGKSAGEKLNVVIDPKDAYGHRNETLVETVGIDKFGKPEEVKEGVQFQVGTPQEGMRIATNMKVEGENVTVDFNHPLADVTLHFDVEVIDVRDATKEEIEHGHVHGPEGHQH